MGSVGQQYEYDVALSFAGEEREYVRQVAGYLQAAGLKVFFDEYEEAGLWGKDLYEHLDEVYRKNARYCVMFLSESYARKAWPNHELKSALARALEDKGEYLLPARFDDTEIPGIRPTVGYIDLMSRSPKELAQLILQKVAQPEAGQSVAPAASFTTSSFRKPKLGASTFNPYEEAQSFIENLMRALKSRCESSAGVSASLFDRNGRKCLRVVRDGETKYSLDIWLGGIAGDAGLSFYGVRGEPTGGTGSTNAWGKMVWNKDREMPMLELSDMSFLSHGPGHEQLFTLEEFLNAVWDVICNAVED